MSDIDAEIQALKDRIATLEAEAKPKRPEAPVDPSGRKRHAGTGETVPDTPPEDYETRIRRDNERRQREEDEWQRNATEGLPPGMYREWSGKVRDGSGRYVPKSELAEYGDYDSAA